MTPIQAAIASEFLPGWKKCPDMAGMMTKAGMGLDHRIGQTRIVMIKNLSRLYSLRVNFQG